jgi:hypothetical protein
MMFKDQVSDARVSTSKVCVRRQLLRFCVVEIQTRILLAVRGWWLSRGLTGYANQQAAGLFRLPGSGFQIFTSSDGELALVAAAMLLFLFHFQMGSRMSRLLLMENLTTGGEPVPSSPYSTLYVVRE